MESRQNIAVRSDSRQARPRLHHSRFCDDSNYEPFFHVYQEYTASIMPPINPFLLLRTLPVRSQPATVSRIAIKRSAPAQRAFTDNAKSVNNNSVLPEAEGNKGPNTQQQEHVSEEAAKMAKATGGEGPDIEGQGTPVQDVGFARGACGWNLRLTEVIRFFRATKKRRSRPRRS